VSATVWKALCTMRCRQLELGLDCDEPTCLSRAVNFRKRLDPPLDSGYCGNGVSQVRTAYANCLCELLMRTAHANRKLSGYCGNGASQVWTELSAKELMTMSVSAVAGGFSAAGAILCVLEPLVDVARALPAPGARAPGPPSPLRCHTRGTYRRKADVGEVSACRPSGSGQICRGTQPQLSPTAHGGSGCSTAPETT